MPKPYAKLSSLDYDKLYKLDESGMGYYLIRGRLDYDRDERALIVVGDRIVPAIDDEFFSVAELWKREPFPKELRSGVSLHDPQQATSTFTLPSGYVASVGALPLLGTIPLTAPTKFYRLIMAATDHRYASGVLAAGTYLTTDLDRLLVNTGLVSWAVTPCRFRYRHHLSSSMNSLEPWSFKGELPSQLYCRLGRFSRILDRQAAASKLRPLRRLTQNKRF